MMEEFLRMFSELNAETKMAILLPVAAAIAGGLTWLLRQFKQVGIADSPGITSNITAFLIGGALGYVSTRSAAGAILGAFSGLAATGAHQVPKQLSKRLTDKVDTAEDTFEDEFIEMHGD